MDVQNAQRVEAVLAMATPDLDMIPRGVAGRMYLELLVAIRHSLETLGLVMGRCACACPELTHVQQNGVFQLPTARSASRRISAPVMGR